MTDYTIKLSATQLCTLREALATAMVNDRSCGYVALAKDKRILLDTLPDPDDEEANHVQ